jgi:cysteine desulfurase family protein (TIGR01976 family)
MPIFDPIPLRAEFPALSRVQDGRPVVFLDGPGGTQVPAAVIDAVTVYYRRSNANIHGSFAASHRTDAILAEARAALADLLGAASPAEVKFGQNMTSLTFQLSRSFGRTLSRGDEVIVSRLDHEANRGPWLAAAADAGAVVREIPVRLDDCTLDLDALDAMLGPRTRLVAVGLASNAVGTVNPVAEIARRAHAVGALVFVDAVHSVAHGPTDVAALGADLAACSVYKFFGPHVGVLWGRAALLESLPAYKVRPAEDRWETGTQGHEAIAGTVAAVDYLATVGDRFGDPVPGAGSTRRDRLMAAMRAIEGYERTLAGRFLAGLAGIPGLVVHGIADPRRTAERTPTVAIRLGGWAPSALAAELGRRGVYCWDGDFYATSLVEDLGLAAAGGVVRLGLVHYNTAAEVDRVLEELAALAAR